MKPQTLFGKCIFGTKRGQILVQRRGNLIIWLAQKGPNLVVVNRKEVVAAAAAVVIKVVVQQK